MDTVQKRVKLPYFHVKQTIYYYLAPLSLLTWVLTLGQAVLVQYDYTQIRGLKEGYFGFKMDGSDFQWNSFSESFPLMILVASIQILLGQFIRTLTNGNAKFQYTCIIWFNLIFGVGYLTYIFKIGIIIWFLYASFFFVLCKLLIPYRIFPLVIWPIAVWTLYYTYYYEGGLNHLQKLEPIVTLVTRDKQIFENIFEMINSDVLIKWSIVYNMTLLRIISWGFDRYWAIKGLYTPDIKRHAKNCTLCTEEENKFCYKIRSEQHLELSLYLSFRDYIAYLIYIPLFITGPAITYNAFISQIKAKQNSYTKKQVLFNSVFIIKVLIYTLRAVNIFVIFEIFRHVSFGYAISRKNPEIYEKLSAHVCIFMAINNLTFIWLKFTTIWRVSRAWAMLDGIDSPENMNRCMFNTLNFEGFWRMWHRGFNQWLIRYIFLPLGGSRYKTLNIWVVFTFVAIWHEFDINLIFWAWGICCWMMPEIAVKGYFNHPKRFWLWERWWFQQIVHMGGATLIVFLDISNFVGFAIGYEKMFMVFNKFQGLPGILSFFLLWFTFYLNTYSTFWSRDREAVENIYKGY